MIYLLTHGEYSNYRADAIVLAPDGDPGVSARWDEFCSIYKIPSRDTFVKEGLGYFSSQFYEEMRAASARIASEMSEPNIYIQDGFYWWLINRCGYTDVDYEEFGVPD